MVKKQQTITNEFERPKKKEFTQDPTLWNKQKYQKLLRHSPTVRSIIGLKKDNACECGVFKGIFHQCGHIMAVTMIFMISGDTAKICMEKHQTWVHVWRGRWERQSITFPQKRKKAQALKLTTHDLNPDTAGIYSSFDRIHYSSNLVCKKGLVIPTSQNVFDESIRW